MKMACTHSCFWWGLFLSGIVTLGGGTVFALLWLFFEWLFRISESSSSDYDDIDDEDKEDKPFDIDDDLSADDEIYIYENYIKK